MAIRAEHCVRRCMASPTKLRSVFKGRLCEVCFRRLEDHLLLAGPVMGLLRAEAIPSLKAVQFGETRVQTSRESKIPFSEKHSLLADELHLVVTQWAAEAYRSVGPAVDYQGAALAVPKSLPAVAESGRVARLQSADVREAALAVDGAASFLIERLDDVSGSGFVRDLHDEVVDVVMRGYQATGQSTMPLEDRIGTLCEVCLQRDWLVSWVGDGPDAVPEVVCKKCRAVMNGGIGDER